MITRQKILITGSKGQLGTELGRLCTLFQMYHFVCFSREELSLDQPEQVRKVFQDERPDYCINCAAYTAVDKAESDIETAYKVNADGPGMLASLCKEYKTRFIHISTDYVFDGNGNKPYKEDDIALPQTVYGTSKLEGEKQAMHANKDAIVIRTSWVYSEFGKNFVKTMLRLINEKKEINVVNDQVGSPTYAEDLAETILNIIYSGKWVPGIYHYSNRGAISWYDFVVAINEIIGSKVKINPISSTEYLTAAKRPAYSVLDTEKISKVYDIPIKYWKDSLRQCLAKMKNA
jgi:dTDP-4-dehydrorhamnose reductase